MGANVPMKETKFYYDIKTIMKLFSSVEIKMFVQLNNNELEFQDLRQHRCHILKMIQK